jgi:hypothetical protein
VQAKRIDPVKLADMGALAAGRDVGITEPVAMASDDGPWLFEVPDGLVEWLRNLTGPVAAKAAATLVAGESWTADGFTPGEVERLLLALQGLARTANDRNLTVYHWICL